MPFGNAHTYFAVNVFARCVVCGEKEIEMDRRNVVNPLALDCMHRPANRSNECYGGDIWPPESRINEKVYMLCVVKKKRSKTIFCNALSHSVAVAG